MRIAITGTRHGTTPEQHGILTAMLQGLYTAGAEFGHGDCVGVDEQAAILAADIGYRENVFPPIKFDLRAHRTGDQRHDRQSYLARNRTMVAWCDMLIGVPQKPVPRLGGTWYTIDYAIDHRVKVAVIDTAGTLTWPAT